MNNDLKIIKKKFGEKMMHFCRNLFPTILETEGLLPSLLLSNFEESHYLYDDIINNDMQMEFKNFIFNLVLSDEKREIVIDKTPEELMDEVGYNLYECNSEEEIQSYAKYYAKDELLCTFRSEELFGVSRLFNSRVFFAVKKDVDKIKREDFLKPKREDEYSTSVLSIQFCKDETHTVSIISRYNHSVYNPNATYSNRLDEIVPGLTDSFAKYKNLEQKNQLNVFDLNSYTKAKDGKLYKFNNEVNGVYYCPNNMVIDCDTPRQYDKSRYLVFDYFVLDLKEKKFINSEFLFDDFTSCINNIDKINIENVGDNKKVTITGDSNKEILVELNKFNQIVGLKLNNIRTIEDGFLYYNKTLEKFDANDLIVIGNQFLMYNENLKELKLDNVISIGYSFLYSNEILEKCSMDELQKVDSDFLKNNKAINELEFPNLELIGAKFMENNKKLKSIKLSRARKINYNFLGSNTDLSEIYLPKVEYINDGFLSCCKTLKDIYFPELKCVGSSFLYSVDEVNNFYAPNLEVLADYSLNSVKKINHIYTPKLMSAGTNVMFMLTQLGEYDFSSLEEYPSTFMYLNKEREQILGGDNDKNRISSK